jgi:hypothetical protein
MSIAINIQADALDDLVTALDTLSGEVAGDQIKKVVGRSMQQTIRQHFERLAGDSEHHQTAENLGGERTGFYERAALGVHQAQLESGGVSVSVELEGLAQRLFGGTIEAKPGSFLTIPARTETYGHRASEFSNLMMIIFPSGSGALVAKSGGGTFRGRGRGKGGRNIGKPLPAIDKFGSDVYYWLVKQVTQRPDPSVLPTDAEILDPAIASARDFIAMIFETGK